SEISEPAHQPGDGLGAVTPVKVVGTQVTILDSVAQHEVSSREHRSRDRQDGLLGTSAWLDPKELGVQVGVLYPHGRPGRGDQRGLEPGIALAHTSGSALAGALIVAWAQGGP